MKMGDYLRLRSLLCAVLVLSLSACATNKQVNTKSSVMEYLYPRSGDTFETPSIPRLNLPLRVGVAFVPANDYGHSGSLSALKKNEILEGVSENFRDLDFVSNIEVIPTAYLTPGGSFANLSQIKTMYGIDVIALVSYDQVQFTDEGLLSLSYWTIVGAYIVSGEKNDTNTLMDTVVYDIASRKMLFRAPGTSQVSGRSTPVNLSEELRADSLQGFELAATEMASNLEVQLETFKKKLKDNPGEAEISHREGYSGGGAMGVVEIILLALLSIMISKRRYRKLRVRVGV